MEHLPYIKNLVNNRLIHKSQSKQYNFDLYLVSSTLAFTNLIIKTYLLTKRCHLDVNLKLNIIFIWLIKLFDNHSF